MIGAAMPARAANISIKDDYVVEERYFAPYLIWGPGSDQTGEARANRTRLSAVISARSIAESSYHSAHGA
jgi:hypothetical protein